MPNPSAWSKLAHLDTNNDASIKYFFVLFSKFYLGNFNQTLFFPRFSKSCSIDLLWTEVVEVS